MIMINIKISGERQKRFVLSALVDEEARQNQVFPPIEINIMSYSCSCNQKDRQLHLAASPLRFTCLLRTNLSTPKRKRNNDKQRRLENTTVQSLFCSLFCFDYLQCSSIISEIAYDVKDM